MSSGEMMERDDASVNRGVEALIQSCRDAGMNVTPQRIAVYRELLMADDHPSPEELYRRVRVAMPSLSLATIYKALDALEQLGLVRELSRISESKRYDANLERHHHMVCTHCRKVSDLYDKRLDSITPPKLAGGFVPNAVHVQIYGMCGECAAQHGTGVVPSLSESHVVDMHAH